MKTRKTKTINADIQLKLNNGTLALVPDSNGLFAASRTGEVYNTITGRVLSVSGTGWSGYDKIGAQFNGLRIQMTVHKAVYTAFNGPVPLGLEISHIDDNKHNNALDNLAAITHAENCRAPQHRQAISEAHKNGTCLRRDYVASKPMDETARQSHAAVLTAYWERRRAASKLVTLEDF